MTRKLFMIAAVAIALSLTWLAWSGWSYLQKGYSLFVSMPGHSSSDFHIDFPPWRGVIHVMLWLAAMSAIVAYITGHRWASTAAWPIFGLTLVVGIYDVAQYGTLGSPTSIGTLLLLLLFALLTKFGPHSPPAKV